jgi:hypothetical protein
VSARRRFRGAEFAAGGSRGSASAAGEFAAGGGDQVAVDGRVSGTDERLQALLGVRGGDGGRPGAAAVLSAGEVDESEVAVSAGALSDATAAFQGAEGSVARISRDCSPKYLPGRVNVLPASARSGSTRLARDGT